MHEHSNISQYPAKIGRRVLASPVIEDVEHEESEVQQLVVRNFVVIGEARTKAIEKGF